MSEAVAQKSGGLSQLKNGSDEIQNRIDMVRKLFSDLPANYLIHKIYFNFVIY